MPKASTKPWPVAEVTFVEVEIRHPRERQMHLIFEDGPRLIIGSPDQISLAAEPDPSSREKRGTVFPPFTIPDGLREL